MFNSASTGIISAAALSDTKSVVTYLDDGSFGSATPTGGRIHEGRTVGIARESKTEGETVPVIIGGVSDVHSGLTQGKMYYIDVSGDLTTSETDRRIGLAISATELLLDIDIR